MKGYDRYLHAGEELLTGMAPNIPNIEAAKGHSFLKLASEYESLYCGTGTPYAFQFIGVEHNKKMPIHVWKNLKQALAPYGISSKAGQVYRKENDKFYSGLTVSVDDVGQFQAMPVFMAIISHCNANKIPLVATATPNAFGLGSFTEPDAQVKYAARINLDLKRFYNKAKLRFIYDPAPQLVLLPEN